MDGQNERTRDQFLVTVDARLFILNVLTPKLGFWAMRVRQLRRCSGVKLYPPYVGNVLVRFNVGDFYTRCHSPSRVIYLFPLPFDLPSRMALRDAVPPSRMEYCLLFPSFCTWLCRGIATVYILSMLRIVGMFIVNVAGQIGSMLMDIVDSLSTSLQKRRPCY